MMYFRYQKSKKLDRKSKRFNSLDRRKLNNHNLDLILKSSETLLEDYVELEVQYIGKLKCVPNTVDITVKKNLLKQMLEAQSLNNLPKKLTQENDSILRLNAFILELLTRDKNEQMIIALPIYNISHVFYTKEAENSHIVAIQNGDSSEKNDYFEVSLLVVKTKNEAELICQLFKKCFELLYIERTMSLLDQVIGDETHSNCSTSVSSIAVAQKRLSINKKSTLKIKNIDHVKSLIKNQTLKSKDHTVFEAGTCKHELKSLDDSVHATIEEFVVRIKKELTKSEYESFRLALIEWQKGMLGCDQFCIKAFNILGKSRIHLIMAMKPFIPDQNLDWFKRFVNINNKENLLNAYWSSESSLNSNSDDESILSHYFSDLARNNHENKPIKTTGTCTNQF